MKINYNQMMKQAQKMQQDLGKAQDELKNEKVDATSGGGMVKVTADGQGKVLKIEIDSEVVESKDTEMLEDLVLVAVNEALAKSREVQEQKMREITGGASLPGIT